MAPPKRSRWDRTPIDRSTYTVRHRSVGASAPSIAGSDDTSSAAPPAEHDVATHSMADNTAAAAASHITQDTVAGLQAQLAAEVQEKEEKATEVTKLQRSNDGLLKEKADLEEKIKVFEDHKDRLSTENERLEAGKSEAEAKLAKADEEHRASDDRWERSVAPIEKALPSVRLQDLGIAEFAQKTAQQIISGRSEIMRLEKEAQASLERIADITAERDDFKVRCEEEQTARKRVEDAFDEFGQQHAGCADREAETEVIVEGLEADITSLEERIKTLEKTNADLIDEKAQLAQQQSPRSAVGPLNNLAEELAGEELDEDQSLSHSDPVVIYHELPPAAETPRPQQQLSTSIVQTIVDQPPMALASFADAGLQTDQLSRRRLLHPLPLAIALAMLALFLLLVYAALMPCDFGFDGGATTLILGPTTHWTLIQLLSKTLSETPSDLM